jgi:DNA-binding NtrC family response regulator
VARILLIDDDVDLVEDLQQALGKAGHHVTCLERAETGPDLAARQEIDLVLLDNKMPGMSGIDFLGALRERGIGVPVILMTGCAGGDTALQAVLLGAFDYLEKPDDYGRLFAELTPLIHKALEIDWRSPVVRVNGEEAPAPRTSGPLMLGKSQAMREVAGRVRDVAASRAPVLILGETGTGKELVARAIHTHSPRKNEPFVALNCTALTETLLEDELFGHEKGAFTGANKLRKGLFEHASGGTLFLDEVGDMPASLQAQLLRVLENQEVKRIGGNETIRVDVRVLSATHRNLEAAIRAETFREDLFYRLNGVTIRLPPLRERGEDLQLLSNHFLEKAAEGTGRRAPTLHPAAWDRLRAHPWPGNIRELRSVLGRAVLTCHGSQILPDDLDIRRGGPAPACRTDVTEDEALAGLRQAIRWAWNSGAGNLWPRLQGLLERELLAHAAAELGGNKTQIGDRLAMSRGTVIQRLKGYGLE